MWYRLGALCLLLCSCTSAPLFERKSESPHAPAVVTQLQAELSDALYTLNSAKVELQLLQEKVAKQEDLLLSLKEVQDKPTSAVTDVAFIQQRLRHLEESNKALTTDVRTLRSCQENYQKETHEQFGEVAKLRSTLTALMEALQQRPNSSSPASQSYKVQPGDTLEKIARRHHTSVDALKKRNQLVGDKISAGETLQLGSDE